MSDRKARKPSVADVNKENAKNNIIRKKNLLEAWANNGIPYVPIQNTNQNKSIGELEYFPRSIRQFNFWDGSANSTQIRSGFPAISRNANDTLRSHPSLKNLVELVLDGLIARETLQQNQSKPIRIKKIRDSLAIEKKLRCIAEAELINVRKQQTEERRKYNDDKAASNSQIVELKKMVSELQRQNIDAVQEISGLKSRLMKVAPLKKV